MFGNIGGKIKVFVITVTVLNIIFCILCGALIITFAIFGDNLPKQLFDIGGNIPFLQLAGEYNGGFGILVGLIVMIAGSLASWLVAFIPYGLGQLIQNTDKLVKSMDGIRNTVARVQQNQVNAAQNLHNNHANYMYNPYGQSTYNQQYDPRYAQQNMYPNRGADYHEPMTNNAENDRNVKIGGADTAQVPETANKVDSAQPKTIMENEATEKTWENQSEKTGDYSPENTKNDTGINNNSESREKTNLSELKEVLGTDEKKD